MSEDRQTYRVTFIRAFRSGKTEVVGPLDFGLVSGLDADDLRTFLADEYRCSRAQITTVSFSAA